MPTLRDVAERAGCSVPAVSHVLNHGCRNVHVGEALAARIHAAAESLGYVPNRQAQALRRGICGTIALLAGRDVENLLWHRLLQGVLKAAKTTDQQVQVLASVAEVQRAWQRGAIDATIVINALFPGGAKLLQTAGIPVVTVDSEQRAAAVDLSPDLDQASVDAIAHLAATGHRHLVWLHPTWNGKRVDRSRFPSLQRACAEHGLDLKQVAVDDDDDNFAWGDPQQADRLLESHLARQPFDAVLAFNERLACVAMTCVLRLGRRIPDDVAVIGYDNIIAAMLYPALSVIDLGLEAIGVAAVQTALARISKPAAPASQMAVATFIPRQSTRQPTRQGA